MNTDTIKSLRRCARKIKEEALASRQMADKASFVDSKEFWEIREETWLSALNVLQNEISRQRSGNREAK